MAGDKTVYDYTHSTISQDRDALREVQRAVAERQQQQQQEDEQTGRSSSGSSDNTIGAAVEARNDANGDAQSSNTSEDEDGKAARALQKGYRCAAMLCSAGGSCSRDLAAGVTQSKGAHSGRDLRGLLSKGLFPFFRPQECWRYEYQRIGSMDRRPAAPETRASRPGTVRGKQRPE